MQGRRSGAEAPARGRLARGAEAALVIGLTVLVFAPGISGEFLNWDDDRNFLANPHYRGLGRANLGWMLTATHMGHWAPLAWITLGADHWLWGLDPRGYHLTSLLFHAGAAALFLAVARRLLAVARPGTPEAALRVGAAGAALLFALHPLRVESVTWITERRDVVSGFFSLLAVLAYLRAVEGTPGPWPRRAPYWASLAALVAAVLSKSMAVTLPAVLLVLDRYPLGRLPGPGGWTGAASRRILAEKIPFFLVSGAGAAVAFAAIRPWGALHSLAELGLTERALVSAYGLAFYLWKTLVPLGLSPLYPLPRPLDPLAPPLLAAAGVVLGLSAMAILGRHRWPWLGAVWGACVIMALPVLGVFQNGPQIAADRYTYLPMLGWALLAGAALCRAAERWASGGAGRRPAGIVLVAALGAMIGLAALASRQSLVWQDSLTLWSHAVALDPGSAQARVHLAGALLGAGQSGPAARQFEIAVTMDRGNPEALIGLAVAWAASGRVREAVLVAREASRLRPADGEIRFHLGEALAAAGRQEEALGAYRESMRLAPARPAAAYRVAVILAELGRAGEAGTALAEAQRLGRSADPGDPEAERAAALVYERSDPARAIEAWERYLAMMRRLRAQDPPAMRKTLDAAVSLEALRRRQETPAPSGR